MIERYTLPEMGAIWSEQAKFQSWLDVEIAATEANCELGRVPAEAVATIKEKASFSVERILEIEAEVRHDVIAFLTNVNEHVGDAGRHIHVGMTSSDVLDTGVALQMKASVKLLRQELDLLADALRTLAREHKATVMIGRSHAIHGEPITFGSEVAKGVTMGDDGTLRIVNIDDVGIGKILVHDKHHHSPSLAFALARLNQDDNSPTPFGVFRAVERPEYASEVSAQVAMASEKAGDPDMGALLRSNGTWVVD